jgi:hypothetical protein
MAVGQLDQARPPSSSTPKDLALVAFSSSFVWPARLPLTSQRRSRRNAQQAMAVLVQRRRDREDLARFLADRRIEAG